MSDHRDDRIANLSETEVIEIQSSRIEKAFSFGP
jgi:hypothetical protein